MPNLKLPQIIGHRGASAYSPENTLEAIHTAADMGVEWVELDVKLTRDNVPIIFHDETLERTTNGTGKICETDYNDIQSLEAGSWFGESFTGIKIPTLEEALEVLVDRDLGLDLEIKPCPGREKETAEIALDILSRVWDEHERLLISSFQHVSLEAALDMAPDWNRGLIIGELPENWKDLADYLNLQCLCVGADKIKKDQTYTIFDMDYNIIAYTVNEGEQARKLQGFGIKTFCTDMPDVLQDSLFSVH